ncbi:MAG: hypothetical protein RLZZ507_1761 [Cyanobacteriota bacterium]|jgi:prepilin-type N-terminal cleavage/methylation domain-containing protein
MKNPKYTKYKLDSGFSLLEVLVAIVAITFFSAAALQMMIISATFKARAKEFTTATNLIQQDLENIKNQASQIKFPKVVIPTGTTSIAASTTEIELESVDLFETGNLIQFTGTPDEYNNFTIDSDNNTITIASPGLRTTVKATRENGSAAILINNTLCSAAADSGLAAELNEKTETNLTAQSFPNFDDDDSVRISNKEPGGENADELPSDYDEYKAVSDFAPHTIPNTDRKLWVMRKDEPVSNGVLEVRYLVVKEENNLPGSKILGKLYSEVIPDASYQCIKR